MKKIIIGLLAIIIIYLVFTKDTPITNQEISLQNNSIHQGELILINKDYKLEQDPINLVHIPTDLASNVLVDSDYLLESDLIQPLQRMFEVAAQDGVDHFIINSAYRSGKLQQQLFEKNGADYALPSGYSEHQTGLALDIGSTTGTMDQTTEGKWLAKHAAEFGFILRYPENKVDVTGISFEPWHFRYVGLPHSVMMQEKDLALEEYMDFLKDKKDYTMKIDGVTYFVQYEQQAASTKIPNAQSFRVSGDNINGFIITSIIE